MSKHSESANSQAIDVVVVGAGFAGIYLIHKLRGQGLTVRAIERGSDVGGTWFWNRYPGARCDIESLDYSYSFDEAIQQEWTWSERFATQPEILRYANWVADRLDIRRHVTFNTTVSAATYDERLGAWTVETGDGAKITARFLILATGALSVGTIPSIEGNERFRGATYHTGSWPREGVNFSGKRVAVIGTGSSGVQSIPIIARQADLTYVLQRTPNYCIPARNRFYSEAEIEQAKARYPERRAVAKYNSGGVYRVDSALCGVEVDAKERELAYWKAWEVGGLGFIKAFTHVQKEGLFAHSGMVTDGVGQALICCAAGLAVAIPLHAGYNYLVSRVNAIVLDMERSANEIVGIVTENGRPRSE